MISDESVQTEGIKSLITVCKEEIINKEDAVFFYFLFRTKKKKEKKKKKIESSNSISKYFC